MDWVYGQAIGFLGNFFALMGNMGVELFELEWVSAIVLFFSRLAWALFTVSVVVCAFECGIEYSTGRGNLQQCGMNIIKGFLAVSLFTVVPVRLYALSVSLQGTFSAGLTGYGRSIGEVGQDIITELNEIQTLSDVVNSSHFGLGVITSPIMLLFCVILMGYAVLKVFFANLKRGGILLIQIAVGSLYMFSVPRGYLDGFMGWMRQVIGLCLTAFLQSTILVAGLMVFKDHALMGVGLMLSAGEVPRIAGSFGLDTTTKANITSAVYTAQSAVNVTRTIAAAIKERGVYKMTQPTRELTMGSLFDGISGFPLASVRYGIEPIWASEIEPFPILVSKIRFPRMEQMGDITKLSGAYLPPVDIICGGSPCQDLSCAGLRAGLTGARSGLFMEQIRIIQEMRDADRKSGRTGVHIRPRFGIWENVVGALSSGRDAETGQKKPGADFQKVLEAFLQVEEPYLHVVRPETGRWEYAGGILGVRSSMAWIVWDAQHFGVPQRRRRVFLVADFAGYSAIPILAIPDSVPGYPAPRSLPRQIAATLIGNSFAYAGRA